MCQVCGFFERKGYILGRLKMVLWDLNQFNLKEERHWGGFDWGDLVWSKVPFRMAREWASQEERGDLNCHVMSRLQYLRGWRVEPTGLLGVLHRDVPLSGHALEVWRFGVYNVKCHHCPAFETNPQTFPKKREFEPQIVTREWYHLEEGREEIKPSSWRGWRWG